MSGRVLHKLTDKQAKSLKCAGRYYDGGGLIMVVKDAGTKNWLFSTKLDGRSFTIGLGGYPATSLAEARARSSDLRGKVKTQEIRDRLSSGMSLKTALNDVEANAQVPEVLSFKEFADAWLSENLVRITNQKARNQWHSTLRDYAQPIAGMPIDQIDLQDILECLKPIWQTKPETARRVQQRIERILAAARVMGHREGENPAQWKNNLDLILPSMKHVRKHHAAMPYASLPDYFKTLASADSMAAACLQFIILTAARSGEGRGARWSEIDLDEGVWTLPPERMKARKEHVVPLSEASKTLLKRLSGLVESDFVFASSSQAGFISEAALRKLMSKAAASYTIHGFRSSFRDWAGNQTSFPRELAEEALAHQLGTVEAAYRREQAVERRRQLMAAWANYLSGSKIETENVIAMSD